MEQLGLYINSGHSCLDYWGGEEAASDEIRDGGLLWIGEGGISRNKFGKEILHEKAHAVRLSRIMEWW